jgi:hypothetical protein
VVGRPESLVAPITVGEQFGVHHATVEPTLNRYGFSLGDHHAILAPGPRVDQGAAAAVLHHELVAEDFRDIALDRD